MNRKVVTICVDSQDYNCDNVPIQELIDIVENAKNKGATHVVIESEYDSSDVELRFEYDREETDEEFNMRLRNEERQKESTLEYKRRELERLKKELGES